MESPAQSQSILPNLADHHSPRLQGLWPLKLPRSGKRRTDGSHPLRWPSPVWPCWRLRTTRQPLAISASPCSPHSISAATAFGAQWGLRPRRRDAASFARGTGVSTSWPSGGALVGQAVSPVEASEARAGNAGYARGTRATPAATARVRSRHAESVRHVRVEECPNCSPGRVPAPRRHY